MTRVARAAIVLDWLLLLLFFPFFVSLWREREFFLGGGAGGDGERFVFAGARLIVFSFGAHARASIHQDGRSRALAWRATDIVDRIALPSRWRAMGGFRGRTAGVCRGGRRKMAKKKLTLESRTFPLLNTTPPP
jgi:hypothetical protein